MSTRSTSKTRLLSIVLALAGAGIGTAACKVINPDHCANQAEPGNVWCQALSQSTPYCSPCEARFHGCVNFEPIACADYDPVAMTGDAVENDDGEDMTMGMGGSSSDGG